MPEPQPDWGRYGPWVLVVGGVARWLVGVLQKWTAARRARRQEEVAVVSVKVTEAGQVFDRLMRLQERTEAQLAACATGRERDEAEAAARIEELEARCAALLEKRALPPPVLP